MKTNWTIIGVLIFCIGASLIIPKVADANGNQSHVSLASNSRDTSTIPSPSEQKVQDLEESYVPPNYGGPDSQHGSGTR
jgi:hypothetical protein